MNGEDKSTNGVDWVQKLVYLLRGTPYTRDQLHDVLRDACDRELINGETLEMMLRGMQVSELRVEHVMVARAQMVVLDRNQSLEEVLPIVIESAHSRFPVIDGDRDKVDGILLAKELLRYSTRSEEKHPVWTDLLRPAVYIPESKRLNVLLQEFRKSRNHMAIVVDEYGGVGGLVTIEDVLEQIVGEIEDETDVDEGAGMVVKRGDNKFIVNAALPISNFNEIFDASLDSREYDTIGGMVIDAIGHVPARGEQSEFSGFIFEVLNADNRRVHSLCVSRVDGD